MDRSEYDGYVETPAEVAAAAREDFDAERDAERRARGLHKCPDGVWRRTPSNGASDGVCAVCERDDAMQDTTPQYTPQRQRLEEAHERTRTLATRVQADLDAQAAAILAERRAPEAAPDTTQDTTPAVTRYMTLLEWADHRGNVIPACFTTEEEARGSIARTLTLHRERKDYNVASLVLVMLSNARIVKIEQIDPTTGARASMPVPAPMAARKCACGRVALPYDHRCDDCQASQHSDAESAGGVQ